MLRECQIDKKATTPAGKNLFLVSRKGEELSQEKKRELLSRIMKIQYYAKKVRMDLLTTLAYLRTRVTTATTDDWKKLQRLLYYINGTIKNKLVFRKSGCLTPEVSVDRSHGIHMDRKGQTGLIARLGNNTIYAISNKQSLVTRSSFECELVGLGTASQWVRWFRNFLINQRIITDKQSIRVWQDNQSTTLAALKGNSYNRRTKHIDIRYFEINEHVDLGYIDIKYKRTRHMLADIFTKPLQGNLFRVMGNIILRGYEVAGKTKMM